MDKEGNYTHVVHVEGDWGGRTNGISGITIGIPRILEVFRAYKIKALFLVSTELAFENKHYINAIIDRGHELGSHGHFHIKYKDKWRAQKDKEISDRLLTIFPGKHPSYCAPWFSYETDSVYSKKVNHVSILKQTWFGGTLPEDPIFYIHPFDIVGGDNAPNLFTRILYGRPDAIYNTFTRFARLYNR